MKTYMIEFIDGFSIRYTGQFGSVKEIAYLRKRDGWTRQMAEEVVRISNRRIYEQC